MERVESEVVLICDGYNREGACDMLCMDVKDDMFCEGHNTSNGLDPREKKSRVRKCQMRVLMRAGLSVVCTLRFAYKEIAIACERYTLIKNIIAHTTLMSVTMRKIATTQTVAILRTRACCWLSVVPLPACLWVDALRTFVVPSKRLVWSRSNLFSRMKTVVSLARFLI